MSLFMSAINNEYRDRGKPLQDQTGLTPFFLQKNVFYTKILDSFSWMPLSIEYQTKLGLPLESFVGSNGDRKM